MKRFLALAALVLGLASCQTEPEGLDVNVGGEVDTFVTVSLPETETRANSAVGAFANLNLEQDSELTVRYIFQVFYNETGVQKQVYYTDGQSASFPVRLVPGRDYNFVAWADIVEQPADEKMNKALPYEGDPDEAHYNTSDLNAITFKSEWNAMDETRDAYTGFYNTADYENNKYTGSSSINIQMTRPFAKLRVLTTDMAELSHLDITPAKGSVTYGKYHYTKFNALTGTAYELATEYKTHNYNIEGYENGVLFVDYFFANDEVVQFYMDVKEANDTRIKENNFNTDIPVKRNYLTTISGNILTDGNKITVDVTEGFANANNSTNAPYYQETISSVAELLAAIKANNGEYILISDLDVNSITASTQAATRTAGVGTTINLNGYTITLKTDIEVKSGNTLIINDINENGENGAIVSEGGQLVNNGTLNIEGGEFGENTIENNNGVVNITGGTINGDLSDFVPDGYDVEENEDGSYTVTESDPVAQIGNETYTTLQAAFDAVNGEATITLLRDATFKNTSVLANGKTVVLDLNGKTLAATDKNVIRNDGGNLTIKNGTITRTGDVVGYSVNNASGEITVENATITRGLYTSGSKMTATNANISHEQSSRHAIYAWNCEVTINSGTYYNGNAGNATLMASGSSVVTINGGTFSIADGRETLSWTSCLLDSQNSAEVVVNDGTYNGGFRVQAGTSMTINGGSFNDCYGSNYNISGTVTVKGGTYTDAAAIAFAKKYVAKGYMAVDNGDVFVVSKIALAENFADNSWDKIILACQNNIVPESWNVGDKKAMTINGKDYQIRILGKNHDTYTAGDKAPLTFQIAEIYGTAAMNATQTNTTGWSGSQMRTVTMPEILAAMPVKDAIKAVNKETLNGTRDGLETTSDKLFLLSEIEVNGSVYFSNNFAEGSRYAFYTGLDSQIMNASYWLRGPGKNNAIGFTQINGSGYMANGSAEYACGVVFGFCF